VTIATDKEEVLTLKVNVSAHGTSFDPKPGNPYSCRRGFEYPDYPGDFQHDNTRAVVRSAALDILTEPLQNDPDCQYIRKVVAAVVKDANLSFDEREAVMDGLNIGMERAGRAVAAACLKKVGYELLDE
jgi:hypothetical protein